MFKIFPMHQRFFFSTIIPLHLLGQKRIWTSIFWDYQTWFMIKYFFSIAKVFIQTPSVTVALVSHSRQWHAVLSDLCYRAVRFPFLNLTTIIEGTKWHYFPKNNCELSVRICSSTNVIFVVNYPFQLSCNFSHMTKCKNARVLPALPKPFSRAQTNYL